MAPRKQKTAEQVEREYYEARMQTLHDADPWKDVWDKLDLEEAEREDTYRNELTGIGQWEKDKTFGGRIGGPAFELHLLTRREVTDRWRGSLFGKKIIEKIPEEMTREGFDVIVSPTDQDETEGADPEEETQAEIEEGAPESEPKLEPIDRRDFFPGKPAAPKGGQPGAPPALPGMPPAMLAQMAPPKKVGVLPEIDDEPARIAEDTERKLKDLKWSDVFFEALCFRRAFGGAAIYVGTGQDNPETPLEEGSIDDVTHLTAFAGGWDGELIADSYYADPLGPNYGKPEIYMLRQSSVPTASLRDRIKAKRKKGAGGGLEIGEGIGGSVRGNELGPFGMKYIHASRLLILPQVVDRDTRVQCRGWGDGVFTRIDRVLAQDDMSWGGISILMQELSQTTLGVSGLTTKTNAEKARSKPGGLRARAREIQTTKSVARMVVYDKNEEIIGSIAANISGAGEVLQQLKARVAAAADMPQAILYGDSPGGLGSNGQQETQFLANEVKGKQTRELRPPLEGLVRLIFISKKGPTKGKEPERWRIEFRPLSQPTEKEVAEIRKLVADTDSVRIKDGVLMPEEVAADAYGGSKFSMERNVDIKGRQEMAEQEAKEAEERQKLAAEQMAKGPPSGKLPGEGTAGAPKVGEEKTPPDDPVPPQKPIEE